MSSKNNQANIHASDEEVSTMFERLLALFLPFLHGTLESCEGKWVKDFVSPCPKVVKERLLTAITSSKQSWEGAREVKNQRSKDLASIEENKCCVERDLQDTANSLENEKNKYQPAYDALLVSHDKEANELHQAIEKHRKYIATSQTDLAKKHNEELTVLESDCGDSIKQLESELSEAESNEDVVKNQSKYFTYC